MATDHRSNPSSHYDTPAEPLLHQEKPSKTLSDWPSLPKPIKPPFYVEAFNGLCNILLLTCSIAFLAFALIVNAYDQAPTTEYSRLTTTLLNATKYVLSLRAFSAQRLKLTSNRALAVFPIRFASVVGRAMYGILLWRLEQGEYVGTLDTLASSTSLTSTVTSQIRLRALSILGITLVAVWSLSPIGGQASVRLITIGSKDTPIAESFLYMVNSGYLGGYVPADMWLQGRSSASVVFVAALMGSAATKSSPLDLWGNVKIPRIEHYEGVATMNDEGWYDTQGGDVDLYSSLVGIPIVGINESTFIDYSTRIQSPYLNLECSLGTKLATDVSIEDKWLPGVSSNASSPGAIIFWDVPELRMNSSQRQTTPPEMTLPLKIKYVPRYRSNITLDCNVTSTYVETEIQCPTLSSCTPSRVRRSKLNHFPPNVVK